MKTNFYIIIMAAAIIAIMLGVNSKATAGDVVVVDDSGAVNNLNLNEQNLPPLSGGQDSDSNNLQQSATVAMFGDPSAVPGDNASVTNDVIGIDKNVSVIDGYIQQAKLSEKKSMGFNHVDIMKDYNMAIMLDEKNADAYYRRANFKKKMSDYQGALEDYNYILTLRADVAGNYHQLASNQISILQKSLSIKQK